MTSLFLVLRRFQAPTAIVIGFTSGATSDIIVALGSGGVSPAIMGLDLLDTFNASPVKGNKGNPIVVVLVRMCACVSACLCLCVCVYVYLCVRLWVSCLCVCACVRARA